MQTKLTNDFDLSEFSCPCCGLNYSFDDCLAISIPLQKIRDDLGAPIIITSGRRCPDHNSSVGGVVNSQHLNGIAVDIICPDVSASVLAMLAYNYGFRSIGIGESFIHLDMRNYGKDYSFTSIWHY